MKIAGASLNQTPLDWANNTANIIDAIEQAKSHGVEVLCLPELCITGYGCEDMFLAPWVAEQALEELNTILKHTENITVALGLPVWHNSSIYNTVSLVSDGHILGFQAKQKLPNYGVHYEQRWFTPWNQGQSVISINGKDTQFGDYTYKVNEAHIGFEICEEAWNEDRPACRLVEQKVNIILNPSGSHFALNKEIEREELVVRSSKDFSCTYVYTNILGNEAGRIIYDGDVIIAQNGLLKASGNRFSKKLVCLTSIELSLNTPTSEKIVSTKLSTKEQFTKAVTLALFDYLRKSRSRGFVLSLSGGADSSSILVLVAEMVKTGIEELDIEGFLVKIHRVDLIGKVLNFKEILRHILITAYQGSDNSSAQTLQSAEQLANSVGAVFYNWKIDESVATVVKTIEMQLARKLTWQQDDIALQNVQARSRAPFIWMLANITNSLLLTTSNRSEGSVGYTTMDGDSSGSLAPIAGIHKSFIIDWLTWAEQNLGYTALSFVNNLAPSAELRPLENTQTDEDDLMPYPLLQQIERLFIKETKGPKQIFNELKNDYEPKILASYITKFFNLWSRNQWKRERIAPSFHLDDYNIDPRSWFRFPILSSGFKRELEELQTIASNH
ncbi:MAG: NAD(+) synthase [Cyclobacteriaceae bacterium]|nr:NAD(+) synthase [Cyclobacteriaceae bacterium]